MSGWDLHASHDEVAWQAVVEDISGVTTGAVSLVRDTVDYRGGWEPKRRSPAAHELRDPIWGEGHGRHSPLHWGYVAAHLRILAAIDYIESLNSLFRQWPPHPWGPIPLARAAIEACARAHWLLEGGLTRRERALRMLAEQLEEKLWQVRVLRRPDGEPPAVLRDTVLEVANVADALGVEINRHGKGGWPKAIAECPYPKLQSIVSAVFPSDDTATATSTWRLYAGISHGAPLAVMKGLDIVSTDDGTLNWDARVRITAGETASLAVGAAYALLAAFDRHVDLAGWDSAQWRRDLAGIMDRCTDVLRKHP